MLDNPEMEELFEALHWFRERFHMSHAGTIESVDREVMIWGVRHPEPEIYLFNMHTNAFEPATRIIWEVMTDLPAPWPWNDEGTGMDYAKAEPVWWEGLIK